MHGIKFLSGICEGKLKVGQRLPMQVLLNGLLTTQKGMLSIQLRIVSCAGQSIIQENYTAHTILVVFTSPQQKLRQQLANNRIRANHIQDPEGIQMYRSNQQGKRAQIQIPIWLSKRPDSILLELADARTLRGAAEYNL
mmetsp:Transcript_16445/g.40174  ORF Transcript_16445/g.40174 Transcript_16445/m.40174 type:complete len:139 (+) Transcript_16445:190-606(+)